MKLIYEITAIAHMPDGRILEKTLETFSSKDTEQIQEKAHALYDEEIQKLGGLYLPANPYDYNPSKGTGYAINLLAVWDTDTGEGGHQKNYVMRTTYKRSKELSKATAEKEEELLYELANPQYPISRFWMDGNSGIGFCDWYELLYWYHVQLITWTHFGDMDTELLYKVGHRHLPEARKIALSLFNKEAEKFSISDNLDLDNFERGSNYIIVLELLNSVGQSMWVEAKPTSMVSTENQEQERNLFIRNNLEYNRTDATPSSVNEIEDVWLADYLTVYDYEVMDPHKKYDLVRFVYNLRQVVSSEGGNSIDRGEEFTHHDLATAKREALKAYREKIQDLQDKYSPDVLDNADEAVKGYNYYLELSEVRGPLNIITEASFSYDGTDITQKDEERRIFELLERESLSPGLIDNRQKTCPLKDNTETRLSITDDSADDDDDDLPF